MRQFTKFAEKKISLINPNIIVFIPFITLFVVQFITYLVKLISSRIMRRKKINSRREIEENIKYKYNKFILNKNLKNKYSELKILDEKQNTSGKDVPKRRQLN